MCLPQVSIAVGFPSFKYSDCFSLMQRAAAEFIILVSSDRILHGAVSMIQSNNDPAKPR
uniref:Uncharacterized protein n=1 Tax=Anopheles funestus TaxID=62324 RepID=A0A182S4I6_ANOFN